MARALPLPATRREVTALADFYGPASAVFVGAAATEESVKEQSPLSRVVHLAVHGFLDPRFPLDSGLLLTVPEPTDGGRDNGFLQAWEIFEELRLNADLVVLSACESGLGKEEGGEGLIGLTRAFQYAGARTVAATLWRIPDQTTAELMVAFHRNLRQGLPADEALRRAQVELLENPVELRDEAGEPLGTDTSAPFFWAGFQLYGDGR